MNNQPKITYRSDTTGCTYQMMLAGRYFTIQAVNFDGVVIAETHHYVCVPEWRANINHFFDVVTRHINTGRWG